MITFLLVSTIALGMILPIAVLTLCERLDIDLPVSSQIVQVRVLAFALLANTVLFGLWVVSFLAPLMIDSFKHH